MHYYNGIPFHNNCVNCTALYAEVNTFRLKHSNHRPWLGTITQISVTPHYCSPQRLVEDPYFYSTSSSVTCVYICTINV